MSRVPRILMCPPTYFGIEYEINPWMNRQVVANNDLARQQWDTLHAKLIELGATIELMEPIKGLPDIVFTANAGLVYGDLVLASRFRHGVRQGETPHFNTWFQANGFRVETLPEKMFFEGAGDALFCGEILFAGYRSRSDAKGAMWIGDRLGVEALPLELVDPRFYHIDTCFCPLAKSEALYFPGAFDDYGRAVISARIGKLIAVEADEAAHFCCNAVVVGKNVILNDGAPKLAANLESAGYKVYSLPLSEFMKAGGSAKCLTLRLDGEDALARLNQGAS